MIMKMSKHPQQKQYSLPPLPWQNVNGVTKVSRHSLDQISSEVGVGVGAFEVVAVVFIVSLHAELAEDKGGHD
jgi:hypothetical protein